MKKRNFLSFIFGLCLIGLLIMPVYAEQPSGPMISPDGAEAEPLDQQTLQQEQENLMQNLPFAFGEFPNFSVSYVSAWSFESWNFDGLLGGSTYGGGNGRWWHSGHPVFVGSIENIPTGAVVFGMTLEACDSAADGKINMKFVSDAPFQTGYATHETIDTGLGAAPGCAFFNQVVDPPVIITNWLRRYWLLAEFASHDSKTHFDTVRLFWSRVISPAPANATFYDVAPGAWYYQGVEALAASNITVGCGGGNFCPNSAVTRAQMAVFLSRALGLNWPG